MIICPYCKEGIVYNAIVKKVNAAIRICGECDTVWQENEIVSDETGMRYDLFADSVGIEPLWDELELLKG